MALVFDHLSAQPATKLVALILADHADSDGLCWPSYRRIAARLGKDERTARRHVKELIDLGVVTKLRTGTVINKEGKTTRITNLYRVEAEILASMPSLSSTDSLCTTSESDHLKVDKTDHLRGAPVSTKPSFKTPTSNRQHRQRVHNSDAIALGDLLAEVARRGKPKR